MMMKIRMSDWETYGSSRNYMCKTNHHNFMKSLHHLEETRAVMRVECITIDGIDSCI